MISAVVPTWNRADLLRRALCSLEGADEVIVVDNGSTEPLDIGRARLLRLDRNYGFAYAVNRGLEVARGDWVAVINNDVVLAPGYLEELRATGADFSTGLILQEGAPDRVDAAFDLLTRGGLACRVGQGRPAAEFQTEREIQFAPWTAVLLRRAVLDRVGLLDESFESYMEDVEFGLRCGLAGIRGRFVPRAQAFHRGSATLGPWHPETVRRLSRNQLLLTAKHFPRDWIWQAGCSLVLGQIWWGLNAVRRGCGSAWWQGKREGWRAWRTRRPSHQAPWAVLRASERQLQQCAVGWFWKVNAWMI